MGTSHRTIEVVVSQTGDISIEAVAFKGADCETATRFLEEALGAVTGRKRKPEYHCRQKTVNRQRLGR